MNRLGMIIDLSGAHQNSMDAVLNITKAPVIFSQSAVYGLFNNDSNILDGTLELVVRISHFKIEEHIFCFLI